MKKKKDDTHHATQHAKGVRKKDFVDAVATHALERRYLEADITEANQRKGSYHMGVNCANDTVPGLDLRYEKSMNTMKTE